MPDGVVVVDLSVCWGGCSRDLAVGGFRPCAMIMAVKAWQQQEGWELSEAPDGVVAVIYLSVATATAAGIRPLVDFGAVQ